MMKGMEAYGGHLRVNGIRQHYLHFPGKGPALVILPGIASPAALWQHVAEFLQPNFDVYVIDVRGRGLSEQGEHLDYRIDACANDLKVLWKELGLEQAIIMGHSMGARLGARFLAENQVAKALIMLDPPASAPGKRPYPVPMERTLNMVEAARRGEGAAFFSQPHIKTGPAQLLRQRALWSAMCDPRAVREAYMDFEAQDIYADVGKIRCPVTLVVAQASGVINKEEVAEFIAYQPELEVICLEGVAHQLQAENQSEFFRFLEQKLIPAGGSNE